MVVTNHALLAIDALSDFAVLPEYELLVVDEAHELAEAGRGSKLNAGSSFLTELKTLGRARAEDGLGRKYRHVGRKETVDVARLFL